MIHSRSNVHDDLPIHTLISQENAHGALMLCGINHGYTSWEEKLDAAGIDRLDKYKSFFSDGAVNDYRLRNRLVSWISQWGLPLQRDAAAAGPLERSIVQTNWLQSSSRNMDGLSVRRACIEDSESFLHTCDVLRPALLVLLSKEMIWALTSAALRPRVTKVFGDSTEPMKWIDQPMAGARRFKIGRVRFERATVLSLPHPTGSTGLNDAYMASQEVVKHEISCWWAEHQLRLPQTLVHPLGAKVPGLTLTS